jgi:hypothetical protein
MQTNTYIYIKKVELNENPGEIDASKKVDLNELLGQSPDTLETLSMECPIFTFATPTVSSTFIHNLSISHVALPKGVDKYIAAHFFQTLKPSNYITASRIMQLYLCLNITYSG